MYRKQITHIYFDLDGPLLDVSARYYFVYKNICKQLGIHPTLDKEEYWEAARSKSPLRRILGLAEDDDIINKYKESWLQQIEEKNALALDAVFTFACEVLEELQKRYRTTLVTLRRNRKAAIDEIARFNLDRYFEAVFVVAHNDKPPHVLKYETIRSTANFDRHSILVGDTEVDINAAKMLGIKSVGVLSGIRNEYIIQGLGPDYVIPDIRGLLTEGVL